MGILSSICTPAEVFQNIQAVRDAVGDFIEKYNEQWLVAKLGYRSLAQARQQHCQAVAA